MPDFSTFTEKTNPQPTDYAVGYDAATPGGEKRYQLQNLPVSNPQQLAINTAGSSLANLISWAKKYIVVNEDFHADFISSNGGSWYRHTATGVTFFYTNDLQNAWVGSNNAYTIIDPPMDAQHMGFAQIRLPASANADGGLYWGSAYGGSPWGQSWFLANDYYLFARVKIDTLSTDADPYVMNIGTGWWGLNATGCYFRYSHAVNGGNWVLACNNNGSETVVNTNISAAAGQWMDFEIQYLRGGSVSFLINGVVVGTISTNLPTARVHTPMYVATKRINSVAGTTTIQWWCDKIILILGVS